MSSTAFVSFLVAYAVCWSLAKGSTFTTVDDVQSILEGDVTSPETDYYMTSEEPILGEDFDPIVPFPAHIRTSFFIAAATTLCVLLSCSFLIGLYEVHDRKTKMPVKSHT